MNMETKDLISALTKVVDAKKATDKAYKALSKAFFNGTDEELRDAIETLRKSLSAYSIASNKAFAATLDKQ